MRISLKKLFVTAAFGFVVGCAPGTTGGDAGAPECELDTDCEGDTERCHDFLQVCEEECTADTDCSGDRPQCNVSDEEGNYILDVDGIRDLCICTADSCAEGEVCSDETGLCEPGEGTGDTCTVDTEEDDCGPDAFCIDGTCEAACFDDECFGEGGLCQYDDADPEFNQCVTADDVTAYCADAGEAPAQSGPPHIVFYDHEEIASEANACGPDGDLTLRSFLLSVYSEADLAVGDIYRANFADGGNRFFGHPDDTDVSPLDGFPDEYLVTVYVCGNPNDIAAYAEVTAENAVSNAYCFDATP